MSESPSDLLVIGRISGCYGIKGWVKIHSFTEPAENMLAYDRFQLRRRSGLETVEFSSIRRQGKGLVAHIKGVDDRNVAQTYKGLELVVSAEQLPALEEGEYYWRDLQGLKVWCQDLDTGQERVLLGAVDYLIDTGANDVLVVKPSSESIDDNERLIPYLPDEVVKRVNLKEGVIEVDWYLEV